MRTPAPIRRAILPVCVAVLAAAASFAGPPLPRAADTAARTANQPGSPASAVADGDGRADAGPGEPASSARRSPRNASYVIAARLDHARRRIRGRETITWRNITSRATSQLQFHLYWNAWRNRDSTWLREARLAGIVMPSQPQDFAAIDVTAIRLRAGEGPPDDLTPHLRFVAPDDGNAADRTVAAVPLPRAVEPGQTVAVEVEWTATIPFAFARLRTGWIDDYYFIAQWFPKIGVLEERGWNTPQFHEPTEFYADFGVYDVRLTLPAGFVVGASGRLVSATPNTDETVTHRFVGEDIADVAWTAARSFVEHRRRFEHPTLPPVEMRLLLQREHTGQEERHFAATAATLRYFGEWFGAYPYDYITIVDPAFQSGSQGMEYPTLFTAGSRWLAPTAVTVPEAVTIHEAGHQWWYGAVSTNEFAHAWMDEGLTTYATARVIEQLRQPNRLSLRYFGGFVPWLIRGVTLTREVDGNRLAGYRDAAESDVPATPTFRYWPGTATAITYNKTSLWLHTLERHLGWPVMRRILATYFERWQFRHPQPDDFFAVAGEVSGQDLTWFFDQVYRSSNVFDYGVQDLISERDGSGRYRTVVVARRYGEAMFPVDVVTTFESGERVTERWNGRDRRAVFVYNRPAAAALAQVDPRRVLLLDVNATNNSRTRQPQAAAAGLRWGLTWMAWLQQLMLSYSFFA